MIWTTQREIAQQISKADEQAGGYPRPFSYHWLRGLQRADGTPLANPTKAKIRNLFSVLFNHAIRYEWLEQGRNPITLVRQSATRKSTPQVLDPK